jgi:hypothetical protein
MLIVVEQGNGIGGTCRMDERYKKTNIKFQSGRVKGLHKLRDKVTNVKIILKWVLKKCDVGVNWTQLADIRFRCELLYLRK